MDDHLILRAGIAAIIATQDDMELAAEAADGAEAIERFRAVRPDVTLMDVQMPEVDGLRAMQTIRDEFPNACIVILTTFKGDVQALKALQNGARGYLLKHTLRAELLETIRAVHAGHKCIPSEVASELAAHVGQEPLSPRELAVLKLIAQGNANKAIGMQLSIAEETVKGHVSNILAKLGANDRTHAAILAVRRGILDD